MPFFALIYVLVRAGRRSSWRLTVFLELFMSSFNPSAWQVPRETHFVWEPRVWCVKFLTNFWCCFCVFFFFFFFCMLATIIIPSMFSMLVPVCGAHVSRRYSCSCFSVFCSLAHTILFVRSVLASRIVFY